MVRMFASSIARLSLMLHKPSVRRIQKKELLVKITVFSCAE